MSEDREIPDPDKEQLVEEMERKLGSVRFFAGVAVAFCVVSAAAVAFRMKEKNEWDDWPLLSALFLQVLVVLVALVTLRNIGAKGAAGPNGANANANASASASDRSAPRGARGAAASGDDTAAASRTTSGAEERDARQPRPESERRPVPADLADRRLTCVECGKEFVWSVAEQTLFHEKNYHTEPKRCPECRASHRRPRHRSGRGPRENREGGRRSDRRGGEGGRFWSQGGDHHGEPAGSGAGGGDTPNPYVDALADPGGGDPAGDPGAREGGRAPRAEYDVICSRCGVPAKVAFKPSAGKPVFCNVCYREQKRAGAV
ncbi:MAG: zinc-ribbon domain containing protein [Planctomycetes bacterium]|nr:zinc-ribbon domain containing protein [Planctomycetota bacterium]